MVFAAPRRTTAAAAAAAVATTSELGPRDVGSAPEEAEEGEARLLGDTDTAAEMLLNEALMMTALDAADEGPEAVE